MPIRVTAVTMDSDGIGKFLHGDDLGDALQAAARDVIKYATPESRTLAPYWAHGRGPDLVIGRYSRRTEEVWNDHPAAAAIEFGSGPGNAGNTGPNKRPQGGGSDPKRILGRAGARVGEYKGELG